MSGPRLSGKVEDLEEDDPGQVRQMPEAAAALAIHIAEKPMLNGEVARLDGAIRVAPRQAFSHSVPT